jgi:hypothetical protein
MGGCYRGDYTQSSYANTSYGWNNNLDAFKKNGKLEDLIGAYQKYSLTNNSGFFKVLAKEFGISNVTEIPKEFPEIEYEVKFDLQVTGNGKEPSLVTYLDAFQFPPFAGARFLKDAVNSITEGVNHFYGRGIEEKLVVIEKKGKTYLKEKSQPLPLSTGVKYEEIVVKRTEDRYESSFEKIINKVSQVSSEGGVYCGKIRKEKGDAFILDTNDGRIYSFTITRAHLIKPNQEKESATQRQLEIEYAGFIPGFKGHILNSEPQIISGMVDLAKYVYALNNSTPIGSWRMNLDLTQERKYDFVAGISRVEDKNLLSAGSSLALPALLNPSQEVQLVKVKKK